MTKSHFLVFDEDNDCFSGGCFQTEAEAFEHASNEARDSLDECTLTVLEVLGTVNGTHPERPVKLDIAVTRFKRDINS